MAELDGMEQVQMAEVGKLKADLSDQDDFRHLLAFLAHYNQQDSRQDSRQEDFEFVEEPTGKVSDGGAARTVSKGYFERFCERVEHTLDHPLANKQPGKKFANVEPICIVDFAFRDDNGLNLEEREQLLERAYCFIDRHDRDCDTRLLVLHVHTMRKWSEAKHLPPRERVQKVTSVNVRHANQSEKGALYKQEYGTQSFKVLPVNRYLWNGWRDKFNAGCSSELEWNWQDKDSFPKGEDCADSYKLGRIRNLYSRIGKVIRLGESLFDNYAQNHV